MTPGGQPAEDLVQVGLRAARAGILSIEPIETEYPEG
jgi:hypothetical protein